MLCSASLPAPLILLLKEQKPRVLGNKLRHFTSWDSPSIILTQSHYFPFFMPLRRLEGLKDKEFFFFFGESKWRWLKSLITHAPVHQQSFSMSTWCPLEVKAPSSWISKMLTYFSMLIKLQHEFCGSWLQWNLCFFTKATVWFKTYTTMLFLFSF